MSNLDPSRGYLHDILDQPRAFEATLRGLEQHFDLAGLPEALKQGSLRRVTLTGMGSSHHALYPLYYRLLNAGIPTVLIETSELVQYAPGALDAGTLVIAVSQSGRSAETVRLLDLAAERGAPLLGVTNTQGSPLDTRATARVLTQAGEEFTVSCKTYVAGLMALRWVEAALLEADLSHTAAESRAVIPAVAAYLADWQVHVASLATTLRGLRHYFLAGRGASLAAVYTGGLTTKESTHLHAEGMSSAALRHGPLEMLGVDAFVMLFAGDPRTRELNLNLAQDLAGAGVKLGWVETSREKGPFSLPEGPAGLRSILEILPVQMFTLALAQLQGRTAGEFERASKVTTKE